MNKVESFTLDHDKVTAPYVRKTQVLAVDQAFPQVVISKFDVRFAQPNQEFISNGALHTLEHFFATLVRQETEALIDISPMGCRTGYYFVFSGDRSVPWVIDKVCKALQVVINWEEAVPGAVRRECGNYLEHDLEGAKRWAQQFLNVSEEEIARHDR